MAKVRSYTLLASAARIATATGNAVDVAGVKHLVIVFDVTAKTGTPTSLDTAIQGSYDGTTFGAFKTAKAFTQHTGTTVTECLEISNFGGKWIRAVGTMVGGSSGNGWTYSVLAHGKMD